MRVLQRRPLPPALDLDLIRGEATVTIDPHYFLTPYYVAKVKEVLGTYLRTFIGDARRTGVQMCCAVHDVLMHAWERGCIWELDDAELAAMAGEGWNKFEEGCRRVEPRTSSSDEDDEDLRGRA